MPLVPGLPLLQVLKPTATLLTLTATGGAAVLLITINPHVYVPPPHTTNGSSTITAQLLGPVHGKVGVKKKKKKYVPCA